MMKMIIRFILAAALLALAGPSHALVGAATSAYGSSTQPTTVVGLWRNQVIVNGGTVSDTRRDLNIGIVTSFYNSGTVVGGTWALRDEFQMLVAENEPSALTLWKGRQLALAVNSPTFTVDGGYACNGTTQYINQIRNLSTGGRIGSGGGLTFFRMGVYERTPNLQSNTAVAGNGSGNSTRVIRPRSATTTMTAAANTSTTTWTIAAESRGNWVVSQAGTTTVTLYYVGSPVGTSVASGLGGGLNANPAFICASNNGGPIQLRAATQALLEWGSRPFGDAAEAADYATLQAYLTTLGAQFP